MSTLIVPKTTAVRLREQLAEQQAKETELQARLDELPARIASGEASPGDGAALRGQLSDVQAAVRYLNQLVEQAEADEEQEQQAAERAEKIAALAELATRAAALRQRLEQAREEGARALRDAAEKSRTTYAQLLETTAAFDRRAERLLPGVSTTTMENQRLPGLPHPRDSDVEKLREEIEQAGGTVAGLAWWDRLRSGSPSYDGRLRLLGGAAKLADHGPEGEAVDRLAGIGGAAAGSAKPKY